MDELDAGMGNDVQGGQGAGGKLPRGQGRPAMR
jgi:hypothetical protein